MANADALKHCALGGRHTDDKDPAGPELLSVSASSLCEAAARGLKAFRESPFCDGVRPGPAARLTVSQGRRDPPRGQAVQVAGVAGQPREVAKGAGIEVRFEEVAWVQALKGNATSDAH
jgi:hypothetical protein